MVTTRISRLSAALLACSVAFPTLADWRIDEDHSTLHFMSTKNSQKRTKEKKTKKNKNN